MDANCPPGRARPRNVVARGQVADTLCVDAGEKCLLLALPSARSSMAGRPCTSAMGHEQTSLHVRMMSVIPLKADIHQRSLHVRRVSRISGEPHAPRGFI